ncbi:MAG TPA: hypothetical protein VJP88_00680 [Caulobacteraceae bacterium]|nr:hypothetical protein [Caulobacteraceae bacterium]
MDPLAWLGWPFVLCLIATVLLAAPIRIFGLQLPEPVFAMAVAFAWAVIRPSLIAPFLLLVFGLFLDLFWGGPAGLWALSLLAAYAMVLAVRSTLTGRGMAVLWIWYAAATGVAVGVGVLITFTRTGELPDPLSLFWQFLATVLLYPFAHRLIERFEDADVRFR